MNNRTIFASNLNKLILRSGKGKVDVANDLNIPLTTFVSWTNGVKFPRIDALEKLAEYFSVSVPELLFDEESFIELDTNTYEIPVYRAVMCGEPLATPEDIIGYEPLPISWKKRGEFFGVKARGDSMYPTISENDILIVRRQATANSGDIAIVKVNGEESTCKKVVIRHDGITLQPLNSNYDALFYTKKQIADEPVTIIGRVIEVRRKL